MKKQKNVLRVLEDRAMITKFGDLVKSSYPTDKNFEIVYVARRTYEDQSNEILVCYRISNPDQFKDKKNPGPATLTYVNEFDE